MVYICSLIAITNVVIMLDSSDSDLEGILEENL